MFWFELKKLTEQSYIDFEKYKPDRTEIQFKPNQFVRWNSVFLLS